jgi:hypothetical protein
MKSNVIDESVIIQACCKIVNTMFSEGHGKEILKIPMPANTISRRIHVVSQDVESQEIILKKPIIFATQLLS